MPPATHNSLSAPWGCKRKRKDNVFFLQSSNLACLCFFNPLLLQVIKPDGSDKETEVTHESDVPEDMLGTCIPQETAKGDAQSPDVIIEAQFDDNDTEHGQDHLQDTLTDDINKLSLDTGEKGE